MAEVDNLNNFWASKCHAAYVRFSKVGGKGKKKKKKMRQDTLIFANSVTL